MKILSRPVKFGIPFRASEEITVTITAGAQIFYLPHKAENTEYIIVEKCDDIPDNSDKLVATLWSDFHSTYFHLIKLMKTKQ